MLPHMYPFRVALSAVKEHEVLLASHGPEAPENAVKEGLSSMNEPPIWGGERHIPASYQISTCPAQREEEIRYFTHAQTK